MLQFSRQDQKIEMLFSHSDIAEMSQYNNMQNSIQTALMNEEWFNKPISCACHQKRKAEQSERGKTILKQMIAMGLLTNPSSDICDCSINDCMKEC